MRLSYRIFLGFFLLVGLAMFFVLRIFMQEVRPGVRQGMEVALVETANLLAELAAPELKAGTLDKGPFAAAVQRASERTFQARIWEVDLHKAGLRVHVMDDQGIVQFDSEGRDSGQDFSRWNDVNRTLRGEYGARSTRSDPGDATSSVMHVAAPIFDGPRIIGVLSVATPTASVVPFAQRSQQRVLRASLLIMAVALLFGLGLAFALTRSVEKLRDFATEVSLGHRAILPALASGELAELGRALESMREKLEGRQYVEHYVHTLTHELKSPLSAIHGAAELLQESMPEADRQRFLANIREQEERLQRLVQRMLDLASVEQRQGLQHPARPALTALVGGVLEALHPRLALRNLRVELALPADAFTFGEPFLLEQALTNLLDNALEFSGAGGSLRIALESSAKFHTVLIRDSGPGIPDYALEKIFDPFYSLPRPDTGKKSTGLGLSFVRQVAELHQGSVSVVNVEGGCEARLLLPKA